MLIAYHYSFFITLCTVLMLGSVAGVIGCFVVLRGQSLFSDAIAHAAFPGMMVYVILTGSFSLAGMVCGGMVSALLATAVVHGMVRIVGFPYDVALSTIIASFFGVGLVLGSWAQHRLLMHAGVLMRFLFGNAALILYADALTIVLLGSIILLILMVLKRRLILMTFDYHGLAAMSTYVSCLEIVFMMMLYVVIMLGIPLVGMILMGTMLVAPALVAQQLSPSMYVQWWICLVVGAIGSGSGALLTLYIPSLATGPAIIVVLTGMVFSACCWRYLTQRIYGDI